MYLVYACVCMYEFGVSMCVCVCVVRVHVCRHTGAVVWGHARMGEYGGRDPWLGVFFYLFILLSETVSQQTWSSLIGYTGWPGTPGSSPVFPTSSSAAFSRFSMGAVGPVTTSCFRARHLPDGAVSRTHYHFLLNHQLLFLLG